MADADLRSEVQYYEESLSERRLKRQRYESMLEKARSFKPPSEDHKPYAAFLVSQLEESIEWDCGEDACV